VDICAQNCGQMGYLYAGLQQGSLCYCGNNFGSHGTSTQCNSRARGNPNQLGGGNLVNTVYRTFRYQGCWGDSYTSRDLPTFVLNNPQMTSTMCINACINYYGSLTVNGNLNGPSGETYGTIPNSQLYAGIQNGTFCFCGALYTQFGTQGTSTACNVPCGGNSQEMCGGHLANSVWYISRLFFNYASPMFGYPTDNYGGHPGAPLTLPAFNNTAASDATFYSTVTISNALRNYGMMLFPHNPTLRSSYIQNLTIAATSAFSSALNVYQTPGSSWVASTVVSAASADNTAGMCDVCTCAPTDTPCSKRNPLSYYLYQVLAPNALAGQWVAGQYGSGGGSIFQASAFAFA